MTVVGRRDGNATMRTTGTGGLLRLDEQFAPQWRARIDGKSAPVVDVEGFSVGVQVPAGDHTVTFEYSSRLFLIGLLLAALSALVLLTLVAYSSRRSATGEDS
jgi:uncharacterized membrane protein YfhO